LAAVWLDEKNRNTVASAADTIDRLLARDPESVGELRFDTVRTLAIPPLGVDYEVIDQDRIIYVLSVWNSASTE
jgi:hypothetical protein